MPAAESLMTQLQAKIARVLVVDDDLHICYGLKDILLDAGYEVETATCGADAREHLDQQTFGVLVVDYSLPDANGMEIAKMVRAKYPWLQTIVMTGHDRVEIADTGDGTPLLAAFLRKPIDVQTILTVIEQTLHRQCDRFQVPRFSPQPDAIISEVIPRTSEESKLPTQETSAKSAPRPLPVPSVAPPPSGAPGSFFKMLPILLIGFAGGWFSRDRLRDAVSPSMMAVRPAEAVAPTRVLPPLVQPPVAQIPEAPKRSSPVALKPRRRTLTPERTVEKPPIAPAPSATAAAQDWVAQLDQSDPAIRLRAAKMVLKSSSGNPKAAAVLLALLQNEDDSHRLAAIEAISVSGLATAPVADALGLALNDRDLAIANAAAAVLARLGEAAMPALGNLIGALNTSASEKASLAKSAQTAIVKLGKSAVPALVERLADPALRKDIIETLGAIGPAASSATPALVALQEDPEVGIAAMKASAQIQPR